MAEEHKYKLTYKLTPMGEGITKSDIAALKDDNLGACDKIIIHSIIDRADGGLSTAVISVDGATGETPLPAEEEFKHWALMAHHLMERLPPGGRRELVTMVHETMKAAVLSGRKRD